MLETTPYVPEDEISELALRLQSLLPRAVRRLLLLALAHECCGPPDHPHPAVSGDGRFSADADPHATGGEEAWARTRTLEETGIEYELKTGGAPRLVIDLRIREAYYRGHPLELPPRAFRLLALLASRSGRPVSKAEIYEHLWPESRSSAADERPYERQIADHKRKLMTRLRALARTAPGLSQEEVERLILMKPRRGYLLNLAAQEVMLLHSKISRPPLAATTRPAVAPSPALASGS